MAYHNWIGVGLVSASRSGMAKEGSSQYLGRSLTAVSALGKSATELYLESGASFKRILKLDQFSRDFGQKLGLRGN